MAITSNLQLANYALSLLGEMTITSLGDTASKAAVFSNTFVEQAILETLAMHEWQEAAKRTTITSTGSAPYGSINKFPFPTGSLRIVEVNATSAGNDTLDYFIEGNEIRANASTIYVRHIDTISITNCGPLLQKACALRLAVHLALPLTGSAERLTQMEALFSKTLGEARARDVSEHPLTAIVLSRLGVAPDTISSDLLRRIRTFADEARKEVLRRTYTSEATALSSMDTLSQEAVQALHAAKIAAALSLPSASDFESRFQLRLREAKARALQTSALNGRVLAMVQGDIITKDLSDTALTEIATFADDARKEVNSLTYVTESTALGSMSTLAQECVDILTARKVAAYLSLPSLADFETLFSKKILEAKARALQTSAINGRVLSMIGTDLVAKDLSTFAITEIATFADEARKEVNALTYIAEATALGSMSTLAQECVDILHARKIATYLSLPSLADFEALFSKKILEAKARALQTTAINGRVLAMVQGDLLTKDISDTTITELATNLAVDARKEVLRTGLFSSSLEFATLSSTAGALAGWAYSFALPTDCLSLVEISSDSSGETLIDYEIIDQKIAVNTTPAYLRYVKDQSTLTDLDVLAQSAIDALHAAKIAHYLTLPSLSQHEELYQLRLRQARKAALDESDISTQVLALVGEDLLKAEINRHHIRWFRRFADEARHEVLRMHRWNCATARAILTPLTPTTGTTSYVKRYALPSTCLRVLEINGESYESGEDLFEIEAGYLYAHTETAWIRYIDDIAFASLDPLLQQAITLRHAAKIAAVTSIPSAPMLEQLAQKRLGEARQANSHVRSADNSPRHRVLSRSTILRARGSIRNPLRLEDY